MFPFLSSFSHAFFPYSDGLKSDEGEVFLDDFCDFKFPICHSESGFLDHLEQTRVWSSQGRWWV